MPGISLITNFEINAPAPIDSRMVVSDITARNALIYKYEGLKVYVLSVKQSYIYENSTWRVEYNGIYGGSGSLPANVTVDFGTFNNNVGSASYHFEYKSGTTNKESYLQNQFIRHKASITTTDAWEGVEFRQQLKYNTSSGVTNSSYISFNPSTVGTSQNPGGIAFGTGFNNLTAPVRERLRISSTGNIGIGTIDPKELLQIGSYSSTQLPLTFHNSSSLGFAAMGYNWYYQNVDSFFQSTSGASKIKFSNEGDILFSTKNTSNSVLTPNMILKDGKVGIGTIEPEELVEIRKSDSYAPVTINNDSDGARIGFNWYNSDQKFFSNKAQSVIYFDQTGGILFKNRNSTNPSLQETLYLTNSGTVGIQTSSPAYTLDVNGVIHSSGQILSDTNVKASINVEASIDLKAGQRVETTNGYFFKNSPNNKIISSGPTILIYTDTVSAKVAISTTSVQFNETTRIQNKFLWLQNPQPINNSKLANGLVFAQASNTPVSGCVIYPFQGGSIDDMGISIYNTLSGVEKESIRTSDGGTRVQIGGSGDTIFNDSDVVDGSTTNTNGTSNSLIDTKNNMYYNSSARLWATDKNLLKSGSWQKSDTTEGVVSYFTWVRVGKVIYVTFSMFEQPPSTSGFRIYQIISSAERYNIIPSPIKYSVVNSSPNVTIDGTCDSIYYSSPSVTVTGKLRVLASQDANFLKFVDLYDATEPLTRRYKRIFGQYMMTLP